VCRGRFAGSDDFDWVFDFQREQKSTGVRNEGRELVVWFTVAVLVSGFFLS
jgi:hypothetical protein